MSKKKNPAHEVLLKLIEFYCSKSSESIEFRQGAVIALSKAMQGMVIPEAQLKKVVDQLTKIRWRTDTTFMRILVPLLKVLEKDL